MPKSPKLFGTAHDWKRPCFAIPSNTSTSHWAPKSQSSLAAISHFCRHQQHYLFIPFALKYLDCNPIFKKKKKKTTIKIKSLYIHTFQLCQKLLLGYKTSESLFWPLHWVASHSHCEVAATNIAIGRGKVRIQVEDPDQRDSRQLLQWFQQSLKFPIMCQQIIKQKEALSCYLGIDPGEHTNIRRIGPLVYWAQCSQFGQQLLFTSLSHYLLSDPCNWWFTTQCYPVVMQWHTQPMLRPGVGATLNAPSVSSLPPHHPLTHLIGLSP